MAKSLDQKVSEAGIHTAAQSQREAHAIVMIAHEKIHILSNTHTYSFIYINVNVACTVQIEHCKTHVGRRGVSFIHFLISFFPIFCLGFSYLSAAITFCVLWIQQKTAKKGVKAWEVPLCVPWVSEWVSVSVYRLLDVCWLELRLKTVCNITHIWHNVA